MVMTGGWFIIVLPCFTHTDSEALGAEPVVSRRIIFRKWRVTLPVSAVVWWSLLLGELRDGEKTTGSV
jgi:hypothetical protein